MVHQQHPFKVTFILGNDGPARDKWPQNIAYRNPEDILMTDVNTIPYTLEGIAEKMVVDRRSVRVTDRGRRMGLFLRSEDNQQHAVTVKVYGFIKSCSLMGNGDWKGYVPHHLMDQAFLSTIPLQIRILCFTRDVEA